MIVLHAIGAGLLAALQFFWDSLFGLIFGFLISAIVQVVLTPSDMQRYLGPNLRGILSGAGFGIIASSCSYGAAAAARGFYQRGADIRSVFSFLVSSTNMNVAILILFWSLLGWKFAFAEFFGGAIIIAVVSIGFTVLFPRNALEELRRDRPMPLAETGTVITECPLCGMEGEREYSVDYAGRTYYACGRKHQQSLAAEPERYAGAGGTGGRSAQGLQALKRPQTWRDIAETAWNDVLMLRTELAIGYVLAGFAAALVPQQWLVHALQVVGSVPYIGYLLLLALGLAIAVVTFVCSMGNVPVARFLANAGIPLGANTSFIYGDLLVPPLIAIYMKSFPPRVTWTFVALFVAGAMLAGAIMERAIGHAFGGITLGSMSLNDRLTWISNVIGILAVAIVAVLAKRAQQEPVARGGVHG
ncbi:MAG TPA: permease [Candidatus Baltobacteraceae bacterium]|jgi:hypothetical protein|nr:permease [Candidatus Baltobacteraceae bacterium]